MANTMSLDFKSPARVCSIWVTFKSTFCVQSICSGLFLSVIYDFFHYVQEDLFQMKLHKLEYLSIGIHSQSN